MEPELTMADMTNDHILQELLETLRDNKQSVANKLDDLDRKLASLPTQLDTIRKESRDASDALRREFTTGLDAQRRETSNSLIELRRELQTYFVPRSEYDPKHAAITDKIREYDQILKDSRTAQAEWFDYKAKVNQTRIDLDAFIQDKKGFSSRLVPWIAIILSALSTAATVALTLVQHVNIH